jgi:hypothetical protein
MNNEVIEMEGSKPQPQTSALAVEAPRAVAASVTPADLLRHALDSGADLDRLEKLMDLQDRWEANEARKAFADAMADFKLDPPKVFKDKHVSFGTTEYDHATLGNANEIIISALAKHGFSHRWVTTQRDGQVIVECLITHRKGHSQSNVLQSDPDKSGGKNAIQAIISARSYLERHTLFDATGLAPKDAVDDDGRDAEPPPEPKPIQRMTINGKRFENALLAVKNDGYSPADIRKNFTLTTDQETALADVEKEMVVA